MRAFAISLNLKSRSKFMRPGFITLVSFIVFSLIFSAYFILRDPLSSATIVESSPPPPLHPGSGQGEEPGQAIWEDKMMGLLPSGFDHGTCLSRHQAALYQRPLRYRPSTYLLSKLRRYEALHRRCAPKTEPYNRSALRLSSGGRSPSPCSYLVWVSFSGLGNQILSLTSAFLYALLTDRVLLVDPSPTNDTADLFCEPFPDSSWLLPPDSPLLPLLPTLGRRSLRRFGRILRDRRSAMNSSFIYLHLAHDYDHHDKLFFCDHHQGRLLAQPWLIMKTDNYFVPSLFLMPSFQHELTRLFPAKASVFHLIGRYLFHPTDAVWGLITRYHRAYLARADRRVGIQIRVFNTKPGPYQHVLDQVMGCVLQGEVLPPAGEPRGPVADSGRTTAVLLTSLSSGYLEKVREMYWEKGTATGEVVGVHQPSQEVHQRKGERRHGRKAWAEMYLLSLTEEMVMSAWSTFGHVGHGLGGVRPWILYKSENATVPDPPCVRAMSVEPCFHSPPFYDCRAEKGIDTGLVLPHVRHCEDVGWGLKLVDV